MSGVENLWLLTMLDKLKKLLGYHTLFNVYISACAEGSHKGFSLSFTFLLNNIGSSSTLLLPRPFF